VFLKAGCSAQYSSVSASVAPIGAAIPKEIAKFVKIPFLSGFNKQQVTTLSP
jgi:hypothetical protein